MPETRDGRFWDAGDPVALLHADLDRDGFEALLRSYWGRRRLGMVIENRLLPPRDALGGPGAVRDWMTIHREHLASFPEYPRGFRLLGTPALTPEAVPPAEPGRPGPPPAVIGPWAGSDADPDVAQTAGDGDPPDLDPVMSRRMRVWVLFRFGILPSVIALVLAILVESGSLARVAGWIVVGGAAGLGLGLLAVSVALYGRFGWRSIVMPLATAVAGGLALEILLLRLDGVLG